MKAEVTLVKKGELARNGSRAAEKKSIPTKWLGDNLTSHAISKDVESVMSQYWLLAEEADMRSPGG